MIRRATIDDVNILAEFAIRIYTGAEFAELVVEFSDSMRNENSAFFIKFDDDKPVGFAEAGLRFDYVEGTDSSPVGYLEGIYVLPEYRRRGFARALVDECEKWAKSKIVRSLAATVNFRMLKVLISTKASVFWKQIELFVLLKSCSFGVL